MVPQLRPFLHQLLVLLIELPILNGLLCGVQQLHWLHARKLHNLVLGQELQAGDARGKVTALYICLGAGTTKEQEGGARYGMFHTCPRVSRRIVLAGVGRRTT